MSLVLVVGEIMGTFLQHPADEGLKVRPICKAFSVYLWKRDLAKHA